MVGSAFGVEGVALADTWLPLRILAGCDVERDQTLMMEILVDGQFGANRMRTEDGSRIIRETLSDQGHEDATDYSTQPAKATLLS